MLQQFKIYLLVILAAFSLIACQNKANSELKVGVIAGPEADLMQAAKKVAKQRYDLQIKIVEFSDYSLPNTALADGSLDANMFQHLPYLEATNQARGYDLISVGKTFIYPVGIYAKHLKKLSELQKQARVAIPNDPSNEARALLLLQKAGLITLKPGHDVDASVHDIQSNPKQLKIKTLDAAQLPRVLSDVEIAVINTNYAVAAGLKPTKDAIYLEDHTSLYVNIIAVRKQDKNDKRIADLIAALHSKHVQAVAQRLFKGNAIVGWQQ